MRTEHFITLHFIVYFIAYVLLQPVLCLYFVFFNTISFMYLCVFLHSLMLFLLLIYFNVYYKLELIEKQIQVSAMLFYK